MNKPKVIWTDVETNFNTRGLDRAKVPGGWLLIMTDFDSEAMTMTFYPDPDHKWDGSSLPLSPSPSPV